MQLRTNHLSRLILIGVMLIIGGSSCSISSIRFPDGFPSLSTPDLSDGSSSAPLPMAQTTFIATLPEPLQAGESLLLTILDEVTGLALNSISYGMTTRDPLTYTATVPLPVNSIVKYRYVRNSTFQIVEDTSSNLAIRYRLYSVKTPGEVQDVIADWSDKTFTRGTGSVQGRVLNADTGTPLPNLLVSAGGQQYITDSAGRFELSSLATGTQNLVVYSMDGLYQTFQQGALIGPGQTTSVEIQVAPTPIVNVTFEVSTPPDTVPGAPVRIAGNLLQLGNTFADLQGGLNVSPDRMPVLTLTADGKYSTTLGLPVGAYVQYKYSLGDGFWNAEHKESGAFVLRELIVPAKDLVIQDAVQTWQSGISSPILFETQVPSLTPPGDIIYIQFNPYGWTEPIPMWPLGNNRWAYKLYGPLNMFVSFGYRYCRNGQCGSTDDLETSGGGTPGHQVTVSQAAQDIQDTVSAWKWFETPESTAILGSQVNPRAAGFWSGVEFQSMFRPNWSYYMPQAFASIQALGANWVILTPSWTFSSASPLAFAPVPGKDPMWIDSAIMISQARALGLKVVLYPNPQFIGTESDFWSAAPQDPIWWQNWFDHYRAFAVNFADLANQTGADALILGGGNIDPALPGGTLPDGTPASLPEDIDQEWKTIIFEVRQHFNGTILWAIPFNKTDLQTPLSFLQDTDGIYLLLNAPLSNNPNATKSDYTEEAGRLLDNEISPLPSLLDKPLYLAIAYPSATGSAMGCVPDGLGGCSEWNSLSQPNPDLQSANLDLQLQADIYEAILNAVNARPWVMGLISRGFYPPAGLQDKSASVHGKSAADILWYWFPRLSGAVQ